MQCLVNTSDGLLPSYYPSGCSACSNVSGLSSTAAMLKAIQDKVKEVVPEKTQRARLSVYQKVREGLQAYQDAFRASTELSAALVKSLDKLPATDPGNEHARLILVDFINNKCKCVKDVSNLIKTLEKDLALLTSTGPSAETDTERLKTPPSAESADAKLAAYGGVARRTSSDHHLSSRRITNLANAVIAGDVKMVALLDASGADLSQWEKVQVANAYRSCKDCGDGSPVTALREKLEHRLGGRATVAMHALRL